MRAIRWICRSCMPRAVASATGVASAAGGDSAGAASGGSWSRLDYYPDVTMRMGWGRNERLRVR
jgi:hypothetical protein